MVHGWPGLVLGFLVQQVEHVPFQEGRSGVAGSIRARGSSPPGYRSLRWGQKEDARGSRRLGGRCHAEGTTGQVVANPGTDHDDELVASRLGLSCLNGRIKGHRHTGRARVAGLLHDHVLSLIHISEPTRRTPISYA